jgi:hypothetical protein
MEELFTFLNPGEESHCVDSTLQNVQFDPFGPLRLVQSFGGRWHRSCDNVFHIDICQIWLVVLSWIRKKDPTPCN